MKGTTGHILDAIKRDGWKVSTRHEQNAVVIECEDLRHKRSPHFVRVSSEEVSAPEAEYLAVVEMAEAVGIDLEDG